MKTFGPMILIPEYRDYVWGGDRLRPGHAPTAEAWVVWEGDQIGSGPLAGRTLGEAVAGTGVAILGRRGLAAAGGRFPLLIKLLDCANWLSLQVHPDNKEAEQLEGAGASGKAESWHILEADEGAELIAGLKPGTSSQALAGAVGTRKMLDLVERRRVQPGDTLYMPPGTVHAMGSGLLLYEVQQNSDITYRVYDWDRPQVKGRVLHIEKSLAVIDPDSRPVFQPALPLNDGERKVLFETPFFLLEIVQAQEVALALDPGGESFHALTMIQGEAELLAGEDRLPLRRFDTVLVPAASAPYRLQPSGSCRALLASV